MKTILLSLISFFCVFPTWAQRKNFTYKFYGFVRGDVFYNSRNNVETVDGNFYLYPKDKYIDPHGKDLNANANGSFYTFTTRLGIDLAGPDIWGAKTSAKVETDFGGFSKSNTMLRIRQAYVNFDWGQSSLLLGQTWHPLFGEVCPTVLNLSTGSPFQPFNRSPQFRYQYQAGRFKATASAIYQLIYQSSGPNGKSEEYLKNSPYPELFVGVDYRYNGLLAGVGLEMLSLKPRTQATIRDEAMDQDITYKVKERITTFSYMAQVQYMVSDWRISAKTVLGENLCHTAMVGGYGISGIDPLDGSQRYTPFRHSTSWLNVVYGTKFQGGAYIGYTKNLGTREALVSPTVYGDGLDMDQLLAGSLQFSYNLPHWTAGIEYTCCTAQYGDLSFSSGRVEHTHGVTNHRILGLIIYYF